MLAVLCSAFASAQMAKFQALYLYKFAQNTSWPPEDDGKVLTITVVGDNSLATELKNVVKNKTVGNRSIKVLEAPTASGLAKSDIIFLGETKSSSISSLVHAQSGNKVLIVSGAKGLCANGAGISLCPDGKFEIHEGNIGKFGLKVAPKLVALGRQVF